MVTIASGLLKSAILVDRNVRDECRYLVIPQDILLVREFILRLLDGLELGHLGDIAAAARHNSTDGVIRLPFCLLY